MRQDKTDRQGHVLQVSRGYAFLVFASHAAAIAAVGTLNDPSGGAFIDGTRLTAELSVPKTPAQRYAEAAKKRAQTRRKAKEEANRAAAMRGLGEKRKDAMSKAKGAGQYGEGQLSRVKFRSAASAPSDCSLK